MSIDAEVLLLQVKVYIDTQTSPGTSANRVAKDFREIIERMRDEAAKASEQPEAFSKARAEMLDGWRENEQPDQESPYKTVMGKPSYIRLTDDLDHAYSQWFNSHGTARHKLVESEFLFWCSANLHHYRK